MYDSSDLDHVDTEQTHINIYCDESRHTSDPTDPYMVIGAIACPREHKREIVHTINQLKAHYNTQGEFGWKRLSPNKEPFYHALLELFFRDPQLEFRVLVADRQTLDHASNDGDHELGFYKHYYQMLIHWLKPGNTYHIYLDWQQNKVQQRFATLKYFLIKKLSGRAKISSLEPVTSHNQPLIELTDLLIGAVGYEWNQRNGSKTKVNFCHEFAAKAGFSTLKITTAKERKKVNIFHFTGHARR